ncbi:MAG: signal peptidase I [Clostridia bacterium]|nr:signal peptidase I [Clostridia bacterium]
MTKKAEKAVNITVDVIVGIIIVFVLFLCVNVITQKDKGYTNIFGKAYFVVQTDSMKGDGEDNFESGDLIVVNILSDEEKLNLQTGDIITFYDSAITGEANSLNSHRITAVYNAGTTSVTYTTKGDNNEIADTYAVQASSIVGTFSKNLGKIGKVVSWFSTSTGYFVCVIIPSFLIVAYCAFNLYRVIRDNKRQKAVENGVITEDMTEEEIAAAKAKERELLKAELMAELEAEKAAKDAAADAEGNAGGEDKAKEGDSGLQTDEDGAKSGTDYTEGEN